VLGDAGRYFGSADDVRTQVERAEARPVETRMLGSLARLRADDYDWDEVTDRYESLCLRLAGRELAPTAFSGRQAGDVLLPNAARSAHVLQAAGNAPAYEVASARIADSRRTA
jgi:hypothetical protein